MSWRDSMLDASFRGITFDVINTRDTVSRDIAQYEYPFVDGGDVDDLGRKPRNLRMTALFWGDDYESRLQAFLVELDKPGSGELIHPVFGSMPKMQLIECQVSHEAENVDYCVVELVFLEAAINVPFFGREYPTAQADVIFNQVQSALDKGQTLIDNALAPLRNAQRLMAKAKALASTSLNMVTIFRSEITGFISSTTDFINYPSGFMADLQSAFSLTSSNSSSSVRNTVGAYGTATPQVANIIMADWNEGRNQMATVAMSDARLAGYDLTAIVKGHRTETGQLWQPGQRIRIKSEPHGIDSIYFLMGREFSGGRPDSTVTTLRLKEDGIWIVDAYPKKHKGRKRKGKKKNEVAIVDVE